MDDTPVEGNGKWTCGNFKRKTIKEPVQVHGFAAMGFKARRDATVDPHQSHLQLFHIGNQAWVEANHDWDNRICGVCFLF